MWTPDLPIRHLPKNICSLFRDHAEYLHSDLLENRLTVVLVPAPEKNFSGHKIRIVESQNPKWYRELYEEYQNFRRDLSLKSLLRITSLKDGLCDEKRRGAVLRPYLYDFTYRELIKNHLTLGFSFQYERIDPNSVVLDYFNCPRKRHKRDDDVPF